VGFEPEMMPNNFHFGVRDDPNSVVPPEYLAEKCYAFLRFG
jgi:hypothetical protein